MKGKILNFTDKTKVGIISAENGDRYSFSITDWKGESFPKTNQRVDFTIQDSFANDIYLDNSNSIVASKKIAAALFAFFLGFFGAHKFYLGYKKQGLIMLITFFAGFILLGIPSMIVGVIAFIEFILYLTKSDVEFEETYVTGKRKWF